MRITQSLKGIYFCFFSLFLVSKISWLAHSDIFLRSLLDNLLCSQTTNLLINLTSYFHIWRQPYIYWIIIRSKHSMSSHEERNKISMAQLFFEASQNWFSIKDGKKSLNNCIHIVWPRHLYYSRWPWTFYLCWYKQEISSQEIQVKTFRRSYP